MAISGLFMPRVTGASEKSGDKTKLLTYRQIVEALTPR